MTNNTDNLTAILRTLDGYIARLEENNRTDAEILASADLDFDFEAETREQLIRNQGKLAGLILARGEVEATIQGY